MSPRPFLALLILATLPAPARASILIFLDDIDDQRFINDVVEREPVKAEGRELKGLEDRLMKLERPALEKLLGAPIPKTPKAYALPLAEKRAIGLSGLRSVDDDRPDEHFIQFHPVGDYAAVEVYYGRTETASEPIAIRIYLRCDDDFVRLNADNFDRRMTWEWEQLEKLRTHLEADSK